MCFSGQHAGAAVGTATNYFANGGTQAAPIGELQGFPASGPLTLRNLRAHAPGNDFEGEVVSDMVVTLLKNGAPTAMTVTITAGSTLLFANTVATAVVAAGDLIDLRVQSIAGGVGSSGIVATVELTT